MPQNQPFTEEEDRIIVHLYDQLKIKQWALVAKKMSQDYKLERNAKQCRDRYRQFLDPLSSPGWTQQEEKQLYRLHNVIGNKWALIASYFPGKSDNYVKNHFYSKIRKALRYINRIIKGYFRKQFKQIKIATIYKIIEGFEQQFKEKPIVGQEVSNQCKTLKDALIAIADENDQLQQKNEGAVVQKQRILIEKIYQFNRSYRKKSKKQKRESLQLDELFKPAKKIQLIMPAQSHQEDSQFEQVNSVGSSQSQQNCNINEMKGYKQDEMRQQKDELRKSPVYVIVRDDQSPNSVKSGIDIRLSDISGKMEEEDKDQQKQGFNLGASGNAQLKCSFGFMRGESSFRSYRSQSVSVASQKSKTDMFGQIRISGQLKDICTQMDMQAERDQSLFRSQK